MTTAKWCAQCGMVLQTADEYHPYAACAIFAASGNANATRAVLQEVQQHARWRQSFVPAQEHTAALAEIDRLRAELAEMRRPVGERERCAALADEAAKMADDAEGNAEALQETVEAFREVSAYGLEATLSLTIRATMKTAAQCIAASIRAGGGNGG